MNNTHFVKITITLPQFLVNELKKKIPSGKISAFVGESTLEGLKKLEKKKALEELLEAPVSFTQIKDPAKYIEDLRESDLQRSKRLDL